MPTEVVTPPTAVPVTVQQIKEQVRVDLTQHEENLLMSQYILAATEAAEYVLQQQICTATLRDWFDAFPSGRCPMMLYRYPVQAVASVKYVDTNGTLQTWSAVNYAVDPISRPCRIMVLPSSVWPFPDYRINAVQVNYTAGYANIASIPPSITQGIVFLVAWMFRHRDEAEDHETVRLAFRRVMSSQRVRVA